MIHEVPYSFINITLVISTKEAKALPTHGIAVYSLTQRVYSHLCVEIINAYLMFLSVIKNVYLKQ